MSKSEDIEQINQALDLMEVERLSLGLWRMYAQILLMRTSQEYAQATFEHLILTVKEASKDNSLKNRSHIQDAILEFSQEVKQAIKKTH